MTKTFKRHACLGIIFICLTVCGCTHQPASYADVLKKNWGISISTAYKTEYEMGEAESVFGDGYRYHILSCDAEDLLMDIEFLPYENISKDEEAEISEILSVLNVPEEKRPAELTYYYTDKSGDGPTADKLYLLLDAANQYLYVVESFY